MATELLPVAATAASSADFTLTADTAIYLKDADGGSISYGAKVYLEAKDDAGNYTLVGELTYGNPGAILPAGTYRARRKANGVSVGVVKA